MIVVVGSVEGGGGGVDARNTSIVTVAPARARTIAITLAPAPLA
jgi:hypothetical protein